MKKLFVEGGGDHKDLLDECRRGFSQFLEKEPRMKGKMPRIIACGGRSQAVDRFQAELSRKAVEDQVYLLIDSETLIAPADDINPNQPNNEKPWNHLSTPAAGGFQQPQGSTKDQCHLMVATTEAWFLADLNGLKLGLGKLYTPITTPHSGQVEKIQKQQVNSLINQAASGSYHKGKYSFKILKEIDPAKVMRVSPWAKRFIDEMAK